MAPLSAAVLSLLLTVVNAAPTRDVNLLDKRLEKLDNDVKKLDKSVKKKQVAAHKIVDGHPTKDGQRCAAEDAEGQTVLADEGNDNSYCAVDDNARVAGVRCCRDDNEGMLDKATAICDGKCERVTYEVAEQRCAAKSAGANFGSWRLCTEQELMTGEDQFFKGCKYDFMYVWASDTCDAPDTPAEFSPPAPPPTIESGVYAIKDHTGKYCADEEGGLICNRDSYADWEKFTVEKIVDQWGTFYSMKGGRSGKYCSDENNGRIYCNRDWVGQWEKFIFEKVTDEWTHDMQFAIKGGNNHGEYCSDEDGGITCSRNWLGAWEKFSFEPAPCHRPWGWCTHPGSTYEEKDCDGDGVADPYCSDTAGHSGLISSAAGCTEPAGMQWPTGATATCPAPPPPQDMCKCTGRGNEISCTLTGNRHCASGDSCYSAQPAPFGDWSMCGDWCTCTGYKNQFRCSRSGTRYCASHQHCSTGVPVKFGNWGSICH